MKKEILIVKDSLDLIYVLRSQVQNLGYDAILAVNGKQAGFFCLSKLDNYFSPRLGR